MLYSILLHFSIIAMMTIISIRPIIKAKLDVALSHAFLHRYTRAWKGREGWARVGKYQKLMPLDFPIYPTILPASP